MWFVDLTALTACVEELFASLFADERERASQSCFEYLKRDFTLARGILRALLSPHLTIEPGACDSLMLRAENLE